jgi:hypothetical protein
VANWADWVCRQRFQHWYLKDSHSSNKNGCATKYLLQMDVCMFFSIPPASVSANAVLLTPVPRYSCAAGYGSAAGVAELLQ